MPYAFTGSSMVFDSTFSILKPILTQAIKAMIEVFKTNITNTEDAGKVAQSLNRQQPHWLIHFDLQDVDRILRIESERIDVDAIKVCRHLANMGYEAQPLE